jgi:hypothetical protein
VADQPKIPEADEVMDISALIQKPEHVHAIGMLTVEITHMERALAEMFTTIVGISFVLGETIYFTVNSGIARMDIVKNVAPLVLGQLPKDLQTVNKLIERAKAAMGKRHAVIHSFWMLSENGEDIRRQKFGDYIKGPIATVSLEDLNSQVEQVQRLTNDICEFCGVFKHDHPRDIGPPRTYYDRASRREPSSNVCRGSRCGRCRTEAYPSRLAVRQHNEARPVHG